MDYVVSDRLRVRPHTLSLTQTLERCRYRRFVLLSLAVFMSEISNAVTSRLQHADSRD